MEGGQSGTYLRLTRALLILQPFRRFTYVIAHSPILPLLHLRHSSFSNPSFASTTSQALHVIHLASRPCCIAKTFFAFCYLWSNYVISLDHTRMNHPLLHLLPHNTTVFLLIYFSFHLICVPHRSPHIMFNSEHLFTIFNHILKQKQFEVSPVNFLHMLSVRFASVKRSLSVVFCRTK